MSGTKLLLLCYMHLRCAQRLNHLKQAGYCMYQILYQRLLWFFPYSLHTCFLWLSKRKAIISLCNIKWMFFIGKTRWVFCKVGNKYTCMYSNDLKTSKFNYGRIYVTGCFVGFFYDSNSSKRREILQTLHMMARWWQMLRTLEFGRWWLWTVWTCNPIFVWN